MRRSFVTTLAVGSSAALIASLGLAVAPAASSAPDPRVSIASSAYQYGNWAQPGAGFMVNADDTLSQVYQLTWRSAFPDLDDTPGPIYAAGTFISSGSTTINRVGMWDDTNSTWVTLPGDDTGIGFGIGLGSVLDGAPEPGVYGMVLGGDDTLYVGGDFLASDDTLNNVGKWNGSDWVRMGWGLTTTESSTAVQDMVIGNDFIGLDDTNYSDDTVYALGSLNEICLDSACTGVGRSAAGIAAYSKSDDTWYALNSSISGGIPFAGAQVDDTLYVGGTFTQINGSSTLSKVARWTPSGWSSLGQGLTGGSVFSMAVHPITKDLYVGGTFTAGVGGATNSLVGVAKWDYTDDTWYAVGTGLSRPNVDDISFSADGKTMYIGNWNGSPTVGTTNANQVAMITSNDFDDTTATAISGNWTYLKSAGYIGVSGPSSPSVPNQRSVRAALALPDGSVMFGGNFATAGAVSAGRVGTFTPGPEPSPYDPVFPAGPPTNVVATPEWNKVRVNWTPPANPGSYPISNYLVQASPGGAVCITNLIDIDMTECTYTRLTPGRKYTFTVQALNGAGWGDRSTASNVASPLNLEIRNYQRKIKRILFVVRGSTVTVNGAALGYPPGTRVTPWIRWNDTREWTELSQSNVRSNTQERFAWKRDFSKKRNSSTLSVKFSVDGNFSKPITMDRVR